MEYFVNVEVHSIVYSYTYKSKEVDSGEQEGRFQVHSSHGPLRRFCHGKAWATADKRVQLFAVAVTRTKNR
jgi:hypothetical protein